MATKVKAVPDGVHTVTPYLILSNAAQGIEFYKKAFRATELMRLSAPGGRIGHAEIQIGDSRIMMADEYPEMGARSPQTIGGSGDEFLANLSGTFCLCSTPFKPPHRYL